MAVTQFHSWPLDAFTQVGGAGVDVFFVISGMVIGLTPPTEAPSRFLLKRFIRIFPLYWLATFFAMAFSYYAWGTDGLPDGNFFLHSMFLIPDGKTDQFHPIYFPAWTLVFEMFFYLVYSALLPLARTRTNISCIVIIISLSFTNFLGESTGLLFEFATGIGVAEMVRRRKKPNIWLSSALVVSSLSIFFLTNKTHLPHSLPHLMSARQFMWGLPSLGLVLGVIGWEGWPGFRSKFLQLGGNASYAIYLVHITVVTFVLEACNWYDIPAKSYPATTMLVCMVISMGLGFAVHLDVEKPILDFLRSKFLPSRKESKRQAPDSVSPSPQTLRHRFYLGALALWTLSMIGLAARQTWRNYSPIPVWDMWEGYLKFYERVLAGDWFVWISRHNEHRLILSRMMFWLDLRLFQGSNIFLLLADYGLLLLIVALFWVILSRHLRQTPHAMPTPWARTVIGLLLTGWLFLLCQGENLTWAFQGQFFLTFLLPLCGLYWLHRSHSGETHQNRDFLLACLFGVLSAGAMGNGILALPLMLAYSLFTRQSWLRRFILAALGTVVIIYYFRHARGELPHESTLPLVLAAPADALDFILRLLGTPFYYLLGQSDDFFTAEIGGGLFLAAAGWKALRLRRSHPQAALQALLVLYCAYVAITTVGVTVGRLSYGVDQAFIPHYTTPALMGWAAILCLYAPELIRLGQGLSKVPLFVGIVALAGLMTGFQIKAQVVYDNVYFQRNVAALALSLGVKDPELTRTLDDPHSPSDIVSPVAEVAYQKHLSIFGTYPYAGSREAMGTEMPASRTPAKALPACQGTIHGFGTTSDPAYFRITGWLLPPEGGDTPQAVRFLNDRGRQIGLAIYGQQRPDLDKNTGAANAGFRGYIRTEAMKEGFIVEAENLHGPLCRLDAPLSDMLVSYSLVPLSADAVTLDQHAIQPGNQWTGTDPFHINLCGLNLHVYSSFGPQGDADTGAITLRIKRGDRFFYRSGPTSGKQTIQIADQPPIPLPTATEWVLLDFSNAKLPDGPFQVTLTDAGRAWGEWSGIALREDPPCH